MRKLSLFLVLIFVSLGGCTLEDVDADSGVQCPPKDKADGQVLAYIKDNTCTRESCILGFEKQFKNNRCPSEFSICGKDSDDKYFCSNSCPLGNVKDNYCTEPEKPSGGSDDSGSNTNPVSCKKDEHAYLDQCEQNSIENCGEHGYQCSAKVSGWGDGKCVDGKCAVTKCSTGFELINDNCVEVCEGTQHLYNGECEDNSLENCGEHGKDCSRIEGWIGGTCSEEGECIASGCKPGFGMTNGKCVYLDCAEGQHIYENECEADSLENCGLHGINCYNTTGWKEGTCTNKMCIVTECVVGYEVEKDKCIVSGSCPPHQHSIGDDQCEDNTDENCGAHGHVCEYEDGLGTCSTTGDCSLKECNEGFHKYGEYCEKDDAAHCGDHDTICPANGGVPVCIKGECSVECNAGYHFNAGSCEVDSVDKCGSPDTKCVKPEHGSVLCTGGVCSSSCDEGYYLNDNKCNPYDADNCGGPRKKCDVPANGTVSCVKGVCTPACKTGFYLSDDKCNAYDVNNCGGVGIKCTKPDHGSVACTGGKCSVTCDSKYHVYDGGCEVDSITNCGKHGTKCSTSIKNATPVCDTSKKCSYTCGSNKVANAEGTHCVEKKCEKIIGITNSGCSKAPSAMSSLCIPTACADGYKLDGKCDAGSGYDFWGVCRRFCDLGCNDYAYNNAPCTYGYCWPTKNEHCKPGYRVYQNTCQHKDYCCGKGNGDCQNCAIEGKTCASDGTCK